MRWVCDNIWQVWHEYQTQTYSWTYFCTYLQKLDLWKHQLRNSKLRQRNNVQSYIQPEMYNLCFSSLKCAYLRTFNFVWTCNLFRTSSERHAPRNSEKFNASEPWVKYIKAKGRGELIRGANEREFRLPTEMLQWQHASCSKCYPASDSDGDMTRKLILSCWNNNRCQY